MLGVRDGLGQQGVNVIIMQRVDDLAPVTFADDQAEVPQYPQLLRDRGLLHPDRAGELSDRAGSRREPAEDPYAAWRRQRVHRLCDRSRDFG